MGYDMGVGNSLIQRASGQYMNNELLCGNIPTFKVKEVLMWVKTQVNKVLIVYYVGTILTLKVKLLLCGYHPTNKVLLVYYVGTTPTLKVKEVLLSSTRAQYMLNTCSTDGAESAELTALVKNCNEKRNLKLH